MKKLSVWILATIVRGSQVDIVGQIGHDHLIECEGSECNASNWFWRPSAYGGWGYDCTRRDGNGNCMWTWAHGDDKQWNDWRTIEQLDNVEIDDDHNLRIKSMGLKDNRIYGLLSPMTGKVVKSYVVKVGNPPSFPSEIKCITLIDTLKMECDWEIDEKQLLPWARTSSSLNYQRAELDHVNEQQVEFTEMDRLSPCPSGPCPSRSRGCCTFDLTTEDIDRERPITYRMEVLSTNLFGERRMQRGNSKIIHVTPSLLIKPLSPVIANVTSPNLYDGSKLLVQIAAANFTQSWLEPVYSYRAEYRIQGSTYWQTTALTTGNELTLSKLLPFKTYEIRVSRMPVFSGFWSEPSEIVVANTQPIEPTAFLQPKFTVLSSTNDMTTINFFWSTYHQRNAPGTAIRLLVVGKDCEAFDGYSNEQRLFDDKVNVTDTDITIDLPHLPCLEASFSVINEKGEKKSSPLLIDLRNGDLTVPTINTKFDMNGRVEMDFTNRDEALKFGLDREMTILLCFTREDDLKGEPETCHLQSATVRDFPVTSKATVTPCYNYNAYVQVEHEGMKLRSKPTQIKPAADFKLNVGAIGNVADKSSLFSPALEVIYEIEPSIQNLYDMHPVLSFKNEHSDYIYHKKLDAMKTRVTINQTDDLVGGGDVEVWLSLCCDENINSCHAHTDKYRSVIQPGLPGRVTDMAMIWKAEDKKYQLEWYNPQRTNAPITGYHVIVQYPQTQNRKTANIEKTFYLNTADKNALPLEEVCVNLFDKVNVTVAAYTLGNEALVLGKAIDYQFDCADLMVVGLSIGILIAIGLLAGTITYKVIVTVMMIFSYVHRQELKTYVTAVVWPDMDKPIIHFPPPSSRDDGHFESEECDKLLPEEGINAEHIDHLISEKKIEENNDQFDSGVSGSEYSGSGKSLPIYRLGYRLDFRRGSHASSGISSGGNSVKTAGTNIHSLISSNHSGDSVLAKSIHSGNNKFNLPSEMAKPFAFNDLGLAPTQPQTVNRLTYVHQEPVMGYSVMDNNFGLKARPADMDNQMNYVGHGYVENTVFNMTNMPTAFIESFQKLKGFKPMMHSNVVQPDYHSDGDSEYMSQYEGYKPISALIPAQQNNCNSDPYNSVIPLATRFNMPTFSPKTVPIPTASHLMPNFSDDEYPSNLISNLIPQQQFQSNTSTTLSMSDYSDGYNNGPLPGMMNAKTAPSGYTGTSGYSSGNSMDQKQPMNDGYVCDDGYNAGIINQMALNPSGYVCDQLPTAFNPVQKIEQPMPQQPPQVSGYLPFNRAMQTFGIDESVPDEYLLSSRLAAFQGQEQSQHDTHLIPVSYVSGYTSDGFMAIPEKKLAPGYLSIEGAELLQQS